MPNTKNPIKAVIFDLDGVLVDAREWHYEALNRALNLFGFNIHRYDHLTTFDGLPTREKLARLQVTEGLPDKLSRVIGLLKQDYTREIIATKCFPVFHIENTVARLRRDGYQLAACTNSIRSSLDLMLSRSNLTDYFELTLSNEDVKNSKPDPEIYEKAMIELGRTAGECLAVEDNQHGVQAAQAAGAYVLQVKNSSDVQYGSICSRILELRSSHP